MQLPGKQTAQASVADEYIKDLFQAEHSFTEWLYLVLEMEFLLEHQRAWQQQQQHTAEQDWRTARQPKR